MHFNIPTWKTSPFIRLLIPLVAGIVLEWYCQLPLLFIVIAFCCFTVNSLLIRLLPLSTRYTLRILQGVFIHVIMICIGAFITWQKDIRHQQNWFGNNYTADDYLIVRINEPPIEKSRSLQVTGNVLSIIHNDTDISCNGKLLLYFAKDSSLPILEYGDEIIIHKTLQPIKNSGNPGAFNYMRYAAFQGIFHTAYLKKDDWILLKEKNINVFKQFIFSARDKILSIIKAHVNSTKDELGIAEALLIGYTNDLDKDLVQAYSNTGVVHIIAISGMHLGLIYVILLWIFNRIPFIRRSAFVKIIVTLSCLWIFSFLTGASASVLRSAVVFTCIAIGNGFGKKSSVYNSLAASAFLLLCYDPYFLWDVGFQLSYFAVISIVVFQKPIYNWFYIENKWLHKLWEMISVTLAAQILTFPVCIYYFHQFPVLFLITNLIVIPLSTVILFAEIFLIALAWIPYVGDWLGKATQWMIWLMNKFILWINDLPFSVIDQLPATALSTWLLYASVIFLAAFFINKKKTALKTALIFLLAFVMLTSYNGWTAKQQTKLIIYNVPQHEAIDLINGNNYQFIGDSVLLADALLQNFHLKPARISLQLTRRTDSLQTIFKESNFLQFAGKHILIIDKKISFIPSSTKINVDIIVISKNPKVHMADLANTFNCDQYVADASNSLWKIANWKKECEKLHLSLYSIPDRGAFILSEE